ncbi:hypothetical protein AGMMS50230_21960 [Spirochaetia bacterium]|nr:hypothetical protein AGMMS50230_21140 [Spirochaetia bacterium]GHV86588.1 hypothetical protein AGMMS50230_21960 [Spirochaetia bacterium]
MKIKYCYEQGEQFLVGWFEDYPEYPTQGEDLPDLEKHLSEIYSWIQDGTLEVKQHHRVLEVAG